MELIRGLQNLHSRHVGCVLTIGKFDGVHLGHQAVIRKVLVKARELGVPSSVMVFEPQPEEVFSPDTAPARLTKLREKYLLLRELGLERLICARFDKKFASQSAEHFIESLLVDKLGVKYLVVGDDFRFGKGRVGDFAMLQAAGERFGFEVVDTRSLMLAECRVSSSAIREALEKDDLPTVASYLGRHYSISGKVIHGQKRGRGIGFPTANLPLHRCNSPVSGVYAVVVSVPEESSLNEEAQSGQRKTTLYHGVANIGHRPTVNGTKPQLEVHIFDFEGWLYGKNLSVEIRHKIREEKKFESFEALKDQIALDAGTAKTWLQQHVPLTKI